MPNVLVVGDQTPVGTLPREIAAEMFCNDMDVEATAFTLERLVPESSRVIFEPVDLSGLRTGVPRTYIRLARDAILRREQQDAMIVNMSGAEVVELDCGHMAMISRRQELGRDRERLMMPYRRERV